MCSTPGGIEAAITRRTPGWCGGVRCAQRPEASRRRSLESPEGIGALLGVLNARRHRGGDHEGATGLQQASSGCSTPGGIEAAITARRQPLSNTADFLSFCMHRHTRFGLGRRDAFTPWPNRGRLLRFSSLKLILLSKIADSCGLAPSSPRRVSRSRHRLPVPELAAVPSTRGRSPAPASTLPHDYG